MVKFGRHIDVFQENDTTGEGLFVVPYNDVKRIEDSVDFESTWRQQLREAQDDFQMSITKLWNEVYSEIQHHPDARGAPSSVALVLYSQVAGKEVTQELLVRMKQIHEAASLNLEGLRKLVKKYDKHITEDQQQLSSILIPLIYTSNFALGRAQLLNDISLLREVLKGDDSMNNSTHADKEERNYHELIVHGRMSELEWLKRLTESLEPDDLARLVAHRGFHSMNDHMHKRPLENSLTAYETAWTSGIHHCECDIALTKDEKLVLAHDDDFSRLALDQNSTITNKRVSDLTFKELLALPLTSIARPPLLIDVLRSAHAIGEHAQLVIEIKPGNEAAASALAKMLLDHPELVSSVSVIMSFDAYTIHKLAQEFKAQSFQNVASLLTSAANRQALEDASDKVYPNLMLLTVSDPPKRPCELQVGIEDLSPIDGWMKNSLDGVYMQFQQSMLEPDGLASLQELSKRYRIGVWGHAYQDPDNYETFRTLAHDGNVSFVNTDLPSDFRKGIVPQESIDRGMNGA